jgi:hypothetical protein
MGTPIGRMLNKKLGVGAMHALFSENGNWYEHLERFPGVLFDRQGYVIVQSKDAYEGCPKLHRGKKLNVAGGISTVPGYVRDSRIAALVPRQPTNAEAAPK